AAADKVIDALLASRTEGDKYGSLTLATEIAAETGRSTTTLKTALYEGLKSESASEENSAFLNMRRLSSSWAQEDAQAVASSLTPGEARELLAVAPDTVSAHRDAMAPILAEKLSSEWSEADAGRVAALLPEDVIQSIDRASPSAID